MSSNKVKHLVRATECAYAVERATKVGITVHDMAFPDGEPPPQDIIKRWLKLCQTTFAAKDGSAISVHCVAGLFLIGVLGLPTHVLRTVAGILSIDCPDSGDPAGRPPAADLAEVDRAHAQARLGLVAHAHHARVGGGERVNKRPCRISGCLLTVKAH
jgi:hypothetical protein